MNSERIQTQIETYTASLPQAVRSPNSAQFGMLLSLIASKQEVYYPQSRQAASSQSEFTLPAADTLTYPEPNTLFDRDLVGRLNHSVAENERGEYAYLVSHLDVKARIPVRTGLKNDQFAQVALASLGGHMLEQITAAHKGFEAVA